MIDILQNGGLLNIGNPNLFDGISVPGTGNLTSPFGKIPGCLGDLR
jgi:hypothetical protein